MSHGSASPTRIDATSCEKSPGHGLITRSADVENPSRNVPETRESPENPAGPTRAEILANVTRSRQVNGTVSAAVGRARPGALARGNNRREQSDVSQSLRQVAGDHLARGRKRRRPPDGWACTVHEAPAGGTCHLCRDQLGLFDMSKDGER